MKPCANCGISKPLTEFYRDSRHKDGLYSECRSCGRARKIEWIKGNPDKVKGQEARKYEKHAEKIKGRIAAWGRANPAKRRRYCEKWASENVDRRRAYVRTRQAMKRMAVPRWANVEEIRRIYAEARSAEVATGISHDVDHIVPLQSPLVCGLHWEGNLRVMRAFDNGSKSNRVWPDMPN